MKRTLIYTLCACTLTACGQTPRNGPSVAHGFETVGLGVGHLVLSPIIVVAGLLEGIAALPVFLGSGVHELNRELIAANAQVTLDDVYRDAYGTDLTTVADDGDTGTIFREMRSATVYFQSMLKRQGVDDAERYLLTAVRTADKDGYTLYAVVRRPIGSINVHPPGESNATRQLGPVDLDFYRPYARDAHGRALDEIVDWAGLSRDAIATQKGQAILLNLAANSILNRKRSNEYWRVEKRWVNGDYRIIAQTRQNALRARMGIS